MVGYHLPSGNTFNARLRAPQYTWDISGYITDKEVGYSKQDYCGK